MNSIQAFNELHQKKVTRQEIERVIALAKDEEQNHLANRLEEILLQYPNERKLIFDIVIPATEEVPASMLNGIEENYIEESLNKPIPPSEIYQMITNKVIKMIKNANAKDYKRKWEHKGYMIPFNFVSKKRYRGINHLMLTELQPIENPFFLTFKQVEELGGKVKKGAQGYEVIYFSKIYEIRDAQKELRFSSFDIKKVGEFIVENSLDATKTVQYPILKYYNVFNGNDIEGINFDLENFKIGFISNDIKPSEKTKLDIPEAIISNYPIPGPTIQFKGQDAYYSSSIDLVNMPPVEKFETIQDFYRTMFHELSHSTGHENRLNRKLGNEFGSKDYAFEELVAELGSIFLNAEAGINWHTNKNHAAYLKSWNNVLDQAKNDNKFIMKAATNAQKIADFVLQFDGDGNPKYLKHLKIKKKAQTQKKPKVKAETIAIEKVKKLTAKTLKVDAKTKQIALFGPGKKPRAKKVKPHLNGVTETIVQEVVVSSVLAEPKPAQNKLMQMDFDSLQINDEWSELMQDPASNMKIAIWGAPKNGKTAGSLQMANYLTEFGNVLYNFADQGFNKSTKDLWISSGLANNSKAEPSDISNSIDLEKEIATGKYKFVFIDMISDYIRNEKLRPEEFKERFIKRFPNVSFILIFEVTKGGNFKGDQGWTHLVDAIMTVEDFLIENRGRYGMGQRVIWEEGFKKFNPKKYQEYQDSKQENSVEEIQEPTIETIASPQFNFIVN